MTKRTELLNSLKTKKFDAQYQVVNPAKGNRFSFRPSKVASHYTAWPKLIDLCGEPPLQGMDEDRANALIDISQEKLTSSMKSYYSKEVDWKEFAALGTGLSRESAGFKPTQTREKAQKEEEFNPRNLRRYLFRPFDSRWCYYTSVPNVWKRSRPELWKQSQFGNEFLLSRPSGVASPEGVPFLFTKTLLARDSMRGHAIAFPIGVYLTKSEKEVSNIGLFDKLKKTGGLQTIANISSHARTYLKLLGIKDSDGIPSIAGLIWMHALAIGYSPAYLAENSDGIREDWPHIPLPDSKKLLEQSQSWVGMLMNYYIVNPLSKELHLGLCGPNSNPWA